MADTKNSTTKKVPPAEKEKAQDKISPQDMPETDKMEAIQPTAETEKEKGGIRNDY